MSTYTFQERPRAKNSNEPVSYDVLTTPPPTGTKTLTYVGKLTKLKNNWHLTWLGTQAKFASRTEVKRHFTAMGHRVEGL